MATTSEEISTSPRGLEEWTAEAQPLSAPAARHVLGRRIREARKDRGMTLRAVARRVGVSLQAISQFEHGRTLPTVPTLVALANAFEVPMGYFFLTAYDEKLLALRERALQLICHLGATPLEHAVEHLKDVSEVPAPAGN